MANKRAVLPGLGIKIVPLLLRLFPARVHPGGGRPLSAAKALTAHPNGHFGPRFAYR